MGYKYKLRAFFFPNLNAKKTLYGKLEYMPHLTILEIAFRVRANCIIFVIQ